LLTNNYIVSEDQIGRVVKMPTVPKRIISTVPSISELLYDLDLSNELIGVTKFCVNPEQLRKSKTIIGGTKNLNIQKIHSLNPDLIIANKEENLKEQIEELEKHFPIWISDVNNLDSTLEMITEIGVITSKKKQAEIIVKRINFEFEKLSEFVANNNVPARKVIYLIWNKPYMAAGKGTFIYDLMQKCNFKSLVKQPRYPELSNQEILGMNPDYIFLSSEPFPFKSKHIEDCNQLFPSATAKLVDGEMFSWYGSHLTQAPQYFIQLLKELNIQNHS